MLNLLYLALAWLWRGVMAKFFVFTAVFALVLILVPIVIQYLGNFISAGSLTSAFSAVSPGVWFFVDASNLSYGLPLVISAWVYRFLIRRLPVIG